MTNKITRQQCEKLLDWLTENVDTVMVSAFGLSKITEKQIMIGDVLEKTWTEEYYPDYPDIHILCLWKACGLGKSLQTIIEESGWEEICLSSGGGGKRPDVLPKSTILKSPEANSLLVFINNLEEFVIEQGAEGVDSSTRV